MGFENQGTRESVDGYVIEKPTDEKLVLALTLKLNQYRKRLEGQHHISDAYKYRVLESILYTGQVSLSELAKQITREGGDLNEDELDEAFAVIRNYVENDGVGNVGGTGLERMDRSVVVESGKKLSEENIGVYIKNEIPVIVKRTSGTLETGWVIKEFVAHNGAVTLYNPEKDISKPTSINELIEWNK
jgi:hypothetical protein